MLLLSSLHNLLQQVLSLPELHTAVLFTPEGQLVSYASDSSKPKDEIRVLVGVSGEVWQETKQHGMGMVDSEVCAVAVEAYFGGSKLTTVIQMGRIIVLPVLPLKDNGSTSKSKEPAPDEGDPVMLVALNAKESVDWDKLRISVCRPPSRGLR
jgi:hypothetical protein